MAGFDNNTLIVLVVVGGATILFAWRWPFQVLSTLVLLIPFRDLSIRWMNASTDLTPDWVNAISRWWFIVSLGLLAVVVLRWFLTWMRERGKLWLSAEAAALVVVTLIAVVHTLISPNFPAAFTSLRGYLQPLAVFVIAVALKPTRRQLQILFVLLLLVGVIMAAFEFWQVAGWNADDYRMNGYLRQNGELVTPTIKVRGQDYIRPTSTVSGPNELGVDMMVLMLLAIFGAFQFKKYRRGLSIVLVPVFLFGVVLTFSRSSMLGMLAAIALSFVLLILRGGGSRKDRTSRKIPGRMWLAGLGLAVFLIAVLILSGASQFLVRTVSNLTSEYHFVDSVDAARFLLLHPSGVGMGMVEPKGALLLIGTEALYHVEGSLFQIGMEMGLWGLAAWLLFWGVCIVKLWKNWAALAASTERIWSGIAMTGWVGALVAFIFLPLMQSISLMVWLWFMLGLAVGFGPTISEPMKPSPVAAGRSP